MGLFLIIVGAVIWVLGSMASAAGRKVREEAIRQAFIADCLHRANALDAYADSLQEEMEALETRRFINGPVINLHKNNGVWQ